MSERSPRRAVGSSPSVVPARSVEGAAGSKIEEVKTVDVEGDAERFPEAGRDVLVDRGDERRPTVGHEIDGAVGTHRDRLDSEIEAHPFASFDEFGRSNAADELTARIGQECFRSDSE